MRPGWCVVTGREEVPGLPSGDLALLRPIEASHGALLGLLAAAVLDGGPGDRALLDEAAVGGLWSDLEATNGADVAAAAVALAQRLLDVAAAGLCLESGVSFDAAVEALLAGMGLEFAANRRAG